MTILTPKVHGILDYLVSVLLIASPWIFHFAHGGAETRVPVILGTMTILYSLITIYDYSIITVIPFSAHLVMDTISGIILFLSPWIYGFADTVFLPHVIFGTLELCVVLMTQHRASVRGLHQHA
jgi:hypothetical protein